MAAGMIYWLLPRLWSKPLYSTALANLHFWIGLVGILLYVARDVDERHHPGR